MSYESREDLFVKVDYEGGVAESIFGYGIYAEDLPEETPARIVQCWTAVEQVADELHEIQNWLYA